MQLVMIRGPVPKVIVLITGGRAYNDWYSIELALDLIGVSLVVHGDAVGADRHASNWADKRGVPQRRYPIRRPNEDGFKRNQRMLDAEPGIGLVLAFPGGNGTADMVRRAHVAGIPVITLR